MTAATQPPIAPAFARLNLTPLQDEGVLMAANEAFFWPLGLALTWTQSKTGRASELHVREYQFDDAHVEIIEVSADDELARERRVRFARWSTDRLARMPAEERLTAKARLKWR